MRSNWKIVIAGDGRTKNTYPMNERNARAMFAATPHSPGEQVLLMARGENCWLVKDWKGLRVFT